jgi:hypothetical protein
MRAWFLLLVLAACARAEAKTAAPRDRHFTVNGHEVTIPGAWVGCKDAPDCDWVTASCDEPETAVNVRFAKDAQSRFDKACKDSKMGMLRVLHRGPPRCDRGECGDQGPGRF